MNGLYYPIAPSGADVNRRFTAFDTEQAFEGALLHLSKTEKREQRLAHLRQHQLLRKTAAHEIWRTVLQLFAPAALRTAR